MANPDDESGTALDIDSMVGEIGSGLGFDVEANDSEDVELTVDLPEAKDEPEALAAPEVKAPAVEAAVPPDEAPKTWRKEASAVWAGLPSEVKSEILKREKDIFQGLETYKIDANFGKSVKSVLQPFEQIMRSQNMDPVRTIGGLVEYHHRIATASQEQKTALLVKMAKDYGIELSTQPAGEAPYVDPTVAQLQSELSAIKSRIAEGDSARYSELVKSTTEQVNGFASNAEHPYFDEVADDIAALIERGLAPDLKTAYEKAVWANPVTRAKEIARETAAATAKATEAAKAKAAAAKVALGANVKTTAKSGRTAAPTGSIDDTLQAAYERIAARG